MKAENAAQSFIKFIKSQRLILKYVHEEDDVTVLEGGGIIQRNRKVGPIFYLWKARKKEPESRHTEENMEHMLRTFMLEKKIPQPSQAYIKNVLKIIRAIIEPHPVVRDGKETDD